jgi:SpoVK/Ycf46/Vps4 family AAA+-type ATPase
MPIHLESGNKVDPMVELDKTQLDKMIDEISADYFSNQYNSPSFTGHTNTHMSIINDPNKDDDELRINHTKYIHKSITAEIKKETILIEEDINNIDDIIKLTEKYKLDPDIIYNINMGALHAIKEPLKELNNMIGMVDLKNNIVDQILYFVQDLHKNQNNFGDFMHTVIYGPPGTGKTDIAKIMGKIYSNIGILKKGTFKKVTRSDLIAGYLGQTTLKTREVIKESLGGVLFIDEAYALGNLEKRDSFAKECIDTLCEALSDNKENLMVIIAGYETELKECFFNYNQGLDSRFTWRFKTDHYSAEDLYKIFVKKVKDIGWEFHEESNITSAFFQKNYEYFPFFGRDIENLLAKTKIAHSKRVFCKPENEKRKITLPDLEKGFQIYMKNDDIKNRKENEYKKKQLYYSLYS